MSNWFDGPYAIEKESGPVVFAPFIPVSTTPYVLTQKFQMVTALKKAAPTALGTAHATYTDFLLVEEGPLEDIGGGICEWTRTYMKKPASWDEWVSAAYTFIGFTQLIPGGTYITRDPKPELVDCRVQHDYYFAPTFGFVDPISGNTYNITNPGDVETIYGFVYVNQGSITAAEVLGGISLSVKYLNVLGSALPTWPTGDDYVANMMGDALSNGWNASKSFIKLFNTNTLAGGPPPNAGHQLGAVDTANSHQHGQIPIENSRITLVKGNLYQRTTRYVLAQ